MAGKTLGLASNINEVDAKRHLAGEARVESTNLRVNVREESKAGPPDDFHD